jgi:hypothetical protein
MFDGDPLEGAVGNDHAVGAHQPKEPAMKLVSAAFIVTVYQNRSRAGLGSFPSSGDAQPEQTGQSVSGSRAVLPFECSALVRVREPNHFRASR